MSGSVHRGVCGREAGPPGPRAWHTAFVIPARATFSLPKPPHAFLSVSLKPPGFCAPCLWVPFNLFFFDSLDNGLRYQCSLKTKSSLFCASVAGIFPILLQTWGGLGLARSVCLSSQLSHQP